MDGKHDNAARDVAASGLSRRTFLAASAALTGGAWFAGFAPIRAADAEYAILGAKEAAIMDALADCIIPPGEYPGGKEAGVTRFIDQQLGGYLASYRDMYETCLPALNAGSRAKHGDAFVELDEDEQIQYLTEIEAGEYEGQSGGDAENLWESYSPRAFFNTARDHCMMGFYGHPRHGGNENWVSYRMLGLRV